MSKWLPIDTAPRDGTEIIVLLCPDRAVPIVRTAWWRTGVGDDTYPPENECPEDEGWWSYRHSVTQEHLTGYQTPLLWMPMPLIPRGIIECPGPESEADHD
jgi:hypothetical protein